MPSEGEQEALARLLGVSRRDLQRACAGNRRLEPKRCGFPIETPYYYAKRGRDSYKRLNAARRAYPELMARIEAAIAQREDRFDVECFLRDAAFDSRAEFAATSRWLTLPSITGWASPQRWGFRKHPVIDPDSGDVIGDLQFPALYLLEQTMVLFPQLHLKVPGWPRLDFLAGRRTRRGVHWWNIEIDGNGHNGSEDEERRLAIGLQVLRYTEAEVLAPDFTLGFPPEELAA